MSSSIWTRSAASSDIGRLTADPWRIVEGQHRVATRKLVESDREQAVLEELLESAKPPLPGAATHLHYLLATPFRYPPLRHGSRFGSRWEPGIWYGSEDPRTAFAEVAYYRLLFLEGTDADLGMLEADLSAFQAPIATARGVDLTGSRFDRWRKALASKTSYADTQPLGAAMREAAVEAFRYRSARDDEGGVNVGVFSPAAFTSRRPRGLQTWSSASTRAAVEFARRDYFDRGHYRFTRDRFLVGGAFPRPALEAWRGGG